MKDGDQVSPDSTHGSPCSFERFLWEWDCWITFYGNDRHKGKPRYDETLYSIMFSDRYDFCHVRITDDMGGCSFPASNRTNIYQRVSKE
jgi:hypothetical protein